MAETTWKYYNPEVKKTWTGNVVYKRKKHEFTLKDLERVQSAVDFADISSDRSVLERKFMTFVLNFNLIARSPKFNLRELVWFKKVVDLDWGIIKRNNFYKKYAKYFNYIMEAWALQHQKQFKDFAEGVATLFFGKISPKIVTSFLIENIKKFGGIDI